MIGDVELGRGLTEAARLELIEWGFRLKHDLGKYVTMQQRWSGSEAGRGERIEALRVDLLETRRGTEEVCDVFEVWAEFRRVFYGQLALCDGSKLDLALDPDLNRIEVNIESLQSVVAQLQCGHPKVEVLECGERATREIAEACRSFAKRLRRQLDGNN